MDNANTRPVLTSTPQVTTDVVQTDTSDVSTNVQTSTSDVSTNVQTSTSEIGLEEIR